MSCSALIRSAPWICTRWRRERLAETLAPVGPQGPPARRCARLVAVAPRARGSLLWTTGTSCVSANLSTMSPNTCPPSPQPLQPGGEGRVRGADEPVCGAAHLTLPTLRLGPSLSPLKGGEGLVSAGMFWLSATPAVQSNPVPRTALRGAGEELGAESVVAPLPHRGRGWRAQRDG